MTEVKRLQFTRSIVLVFFAIGIIMSWKLWGSDRLFPLCPLGDLIPAFSPQTGALLAGTLVILMVISAIFINRWLLGLCLFLLLFLLMQDQTRWQPWVYLYFFLLVPFLGQESGKFNFLNYLQILMIGVYLWSGLYKFNPGFVEITFDRMLYYLFFIEDAEKRESVLFLGYLIPVIEVSIAFLLVYRRTRMLGVLGAILMHIIVLTYLIVAGHNTIVYPWNFAMILLVVILFYKSDNGVFQFGMQSWFLRLTSFIGVLLFLILPLFARVGLWDNYLSFKLYSGTNGIYCIGIDEDQIKHVDEALYPYLWPVKRVPGKYWIYLNKWAIDELNAPLYPEIRTFKQVGRSFCGGEIPESALRFYRFEEDFDTGPYVEFDCTDL